MKALKLLFLLCVTSGFAQVPANDECANRTSITVGTTTFEQYSVNFTDATESLDASCETPTDTNKDVWYEFVMPIDGILFISNLSSIDYASLYDSCGGTEIACGNDETSFSDLISGTTYVLRVSRRFNNTISFRVQAFEVAANDECDNRETITVVTSNFIEYSPNSRAATESLDASCEDAINNNLDLWYEFVMPVNGHIEVKEAAQFQFQTYSLFDDCGGLELYCVYDRGFFLNLTAGTTYVLRIADRENRAGPINFRIQAFEYASNDECNASETILIETANTNTYTADFRTATESLDASCEEQSNANYDLWFDFIMPITGNLKIDQITGIETVTVYDVCNGTELSCQSGLQFVSGLTENTTYLLRISSVSLANKTPRFQAFPAAANDECANSEILSVTTENFSEYTVDTRTATESLDSSCDTASDTNLDLWYDIVMPVSGNLQVSNVGFQFRTALYDACSGAELDCSNGNSTYENLALNSNYKLRVSQRENDAISVTFRLQAFENIFNDECITPQDITIIENEFSTYATNNAAATNSVNSSCEPSSENLTVLDVWYLFTMPSNNDIEIEHLNDALNGYYALYDSCGTSELQCFTDNGFFNNLSGGNEYLLKVGNLSSQSGVLSFNISAKSETLSAEDLSLEGIALYPNPVKDILQLSMGHQIIIHAVDIYEISGRLVMTVPNEASQNHLNINISALKSALYIIVITSNKGQMTRRIIKQ